MLSDLAQSCEEGLTFCESQISMIKNFSSNLESDKQCMSLYWQFVKQFMYSGTSRVKMQDLSNIFYQYYHESNNPTGSTFEQIILDICPLSTDFRLIDLLIRGKWKQALNFASETGDFVNSFAIAGCLDLKSELIRNRHFQTDQSNFLISLKQCMSNQTAERKYLLPMIYSFLCGSFVCKLGFDDEQYVLEYWPLILAIMLATKSEFSEELISNSLKQMITVLSNNLFIFPPQNNFF